MNIFYLDHNPVKAAQMQCDRHVVKMILETAQLLSTAHSELDGIQVAYRATHKNHPSTVWVRSSAAAYEWAFKHMMALGDEYTKRYGKINKTIARHHEALHNLPAALLACRKPLVDPPQCMPDECKRDCAVQAYRAYYKYKADDWLSKGRPMTWKKEAA